MQRREQADHIALVQHLRQRAVPGLLWFHPPMGGYYGGTRQGALMKALGARAGVSDLILLHNGTMYALELKRVRGGRATAEQRKFLDDMIVAGGQARMVRGLDEALAWLERWGLIRGETNIQHELFRGEANIQYSLFEFIPPVVIDGPPKVPRGSNLQSRKRRSKVIDPTQNKGPAAR